MAVAAECSVLTHLSTFFLLEVEDPKVNKAKYLTKSAFSFSVMADLACDSLENMEMFSENVSQCESLFEGNQNPSSSKDTHATDNELPPLDNTTTNYGNPPATQTKSKVSMDLNSAARAIGYYDRLDRLLDKLESRFHRALSKSNFSEEENFVLPEDIAQRKVASGEESCSKCGNQLRQQKSKEEPESDRKDAEMNNLVSSKIVPKVKECDWEHFVNRFSETEEICAIEVLLAGPELGKDVADEDDKRSFRRSSGPHNSPPPRPYARDCDSLIQATHKVYKVKNESQWVHRVRIQSSALLQIFSKVSGYVWGSKAHTFVRPFKYLIFFHEKFKNELQQMEMESLSCERTGDQSRGQNQEVDLPMASTTNTGKHSSTKTTHSTSNSQRNTKSLHGSDALDDLRCYIDFAEEKLIPQYKRFQAGNCSTTTKIRFDDLWYLFRPGELIYLPKKTLINAANLLKTDMNIISTGDNSHESSLFQQIWRVHIGQAPPVQLNVVGEDSDPDSVFSITCHYLDYDGSSYRPVTQSFWIPSFKGEREITELDFYPLRFAEGGDRILRNHQQQGRLFTERLSQWHLSYEGWTFVTDPIGVPIPDTDKNYAQSQLMQRRTEHIEGEVIVDFGEAFNSYPFYKQSLTDVTAIAVESTSDITESPHPIIVWANSRREWQISESREAVIWNDDCDLQEYNVYLRKDPYLGKEVAPHIVPDGDDLALLPPRLFVYSLQQQLFVPVNVRYLKPIPVSCSDAFSHLQLPDDHKRIIQAAVHSHLRRHQIERKIQSIDDGEIRTQDFILSKGRGLLIMLHGEPGVGKTATAEAVSQSTQRPLFSISCSTLQNYRAGKSTEERIMEIFRLAHLWDCVLLMDEADVFLSSRSLPGGRDSMVSSMSLNFLCQIEGMSSL